MEWFASGREGCLAAEQRGRLEVNTGALGSVAGKSSEKLHGIAVSKTSLFPCLADKRLPARDSRHCEAPAAALSQPAPPARHGMARHWLWWGFPATRVNLGREVIWTFVRFVCPTPQEPAENPRPYYLKVLMCLGPRVLVCTGAATAASIVPGRGDLLRRTPATKSFLSIQAISPWMDSCSRRRGRLGDFDC